MTLGIGGLVLMASMSGARTVSVGEAALITGGEIYIDITAPNVANATFNSEHDNVLVTANLDNTGPSASVITKIDGTTQLDMSQSGFLGVQTYRDRSVAFPYGTSYHQIEVETSQPEHPESDTHRSQVRISPSVHLALIRFHETTVWDEGAPLFSTEAGTSGCGGGGCEAWWNTWTDSATVSYAVIAATNSMDAIMGQCSGSSQWQFRDQGTRGNVEVAQTCATMRGGGGPSDNWDVCVQVYEDQHELLSDADRHLDIFVAHELKYWDPVLAEYGEAGGASPAIGGPRRWILIDDETTSASTTLHEIGHSVGFYHTNAGGDPSYPYREGPGGDCYDEGVLLPKVDRALMCSPSGLRMNANVCTGFYSATESVTGNLINHAKYYDWHNGQYPN